jgi:glycosyltransferase involved in cell wall biosynthesis
MRMIHHFCPTSRELVIREYPSTANRNHVVTTPFNYDRLLPDHRDREAARKEFGIEASDFVVLAFGAIRLWDEAMLLKTAVSSARVPRMRILMAARYNEPQSPMRRQWRRWIWKRWLRSSNIIPVDRYVPDEEVHKLFDAADVVVVPRMNSLASGVPSVAMTFGKLVIAPDFGVMPDFLAGTDNLLYKMGDPDSLRKAIEKASTLDLGPIGKNNRKVADGWSWEGITKTLLEQIDRM